jgi:hypothetical protein
MKLFSDAGTGKRFTYFLVTDEHGCVLGSKYTVTKFWPHVHIDPEIYAMLGAMLVITVRSKDDRNIIYTDSVKTKKFFCTEFSHKKFNLHMYQFYTLGTRLMQEYNIKIAYIPRSLNKAGQILENRRFSKIPEADGFPKVIYELRRIKSETEG